MLDPNAVARRQRPSSIHRFHGPQSLNTYRDFINQNFPPLALRSGAGGDFRAEVSTLELPEGTLATIRASAHAVTRSRALSNGADEGFIKLMWRTAGKVIVEQDGRSARLHTTVASVCDSARPYEVSCSDDAAFAVLTLPYRSCPGWERISTDVCGSVLSGMSSRAALGALSALFDVSCDDNDNPDDTLSAIRLMLSSSLHRAANEASTTGRNTQRIARAWRHICEHATDPDLTPGTLAAALCVSRRALYQIFSAHGLTPARLILDTRLERCRAALLDPAQRHRSITDIVFEFGFCDTSSFCRLYKSRYGMSPSESRLLENLRDCAVTPMGVTV